MLNQNSVSLTKFSVRLSALLIKGAILKIVASGNSLSNSYSPINFDFKSIDSELGSTPKEEK